MIDQKDASIQLPDFSGLNVLVVGDVMIDRYLTGSVDRISPEAPVPVVRLSTEENRLGGAANVALNLRALGATPYLCTLVGKDANGSRFCELLPESNINNRYILFSDARCTTVKTRVISQNQQLMRVDREDTHPLQDMEANELLELITSVIETKSIDVILLQDYNKGVLTPTMISEIILLGIKEDIPIAVDPKKDNFWAYKHVTLFKPNLREMQQQLDFPLQPDLPSLDRATELLRQRLGNQYTMITLSERGLYLHDGHRGQIVPTQARSIADVSGAGDTVISIVALCLVLGLDLQLTAHLANLAGGQVVEKPGVVPVDYQQLRREFQAFQPHS